MNPADLIQELRDKLADFKKFPAPDRRCQTALMGFNSLCSTKNISLLLDTLAANVKELAEAQEQARHYPTVAGENMRLREALAEIRAENERLREDAERWRALISSQRMHFMGCAGIELVNKPGTTSRKTADLTPVMKPGEYQHFGMEFWSEHKAFGDPEWPDDFERSLLIAYVDNLRTASRSLGLLDGEVGG